MSFPHLEDSFQFKINLTFPLKLLIQAGKYNMNILENTLPEKQILNCIQRTEYIPSSAG